MLANVRLDKKIFLLSQLFILFLGCLITFSIFGLNSAVSYTLGGFVVFCANFIFFMRMFMKKQFDPTIEILIFYMSEMLKLTMVVVATIVFAIYVKPELFPYIFGLISLQLVMCFVPMFFKKVR